MLLLDAHIHIHARAQPQVYTQSRTHIGTHTHTHMHMHSRTTTHTRPLVPHTYNSPFVATAAIPEPRVAHNMLFFCHLSFRIDGGSLIVGREVCISDPSRHLGQQPREISQLATRYIAQLRPSRRCYNQNLYSLKPHSRL